MCLSMFSQLFSESLSSCEHTVTELEAKLSIFQLIREDEEFLIWIQEALGEHQNYQKTSENMS